MSTSESPPFIVPSALHAEVGQGEDIKSDELSEQDANQIVISSINKDEPVVTRKELWSYYREFWYTYIAIL
jgi:hypothetical protein